MREERVARRYARALFQVALREQAVEVVNEALHQLLRALQEQPSLQRLLLTPYIPRERKRQMIRQAIERQTHPLLVSLVDVVVDKRREGILPEIAREFAALRDEHLGIVRVHVTTAYLLAPQQEEALIQSLQQRTGKTVVLETQVDPSLIGGVMVRIGDTVIDGSLRGQLQRLKQYLLNA
jgi:F-type H+-transporting ATPase subunit delta